MPHKNAAVEGDNRKVLLFNGSTRKDGCTHTALSEVAGALHAEGLETGLLQLGGGTVRDYTGCGGCVGKGFLSVLDRMFYAGSDAFFHKPGAAVVSARRAGTTASLDVLYQCFAIAQMAVVTGDVPPNTVVAGVSARILRKMETEETI